MNEPVATQVVKVFPTVEKFPRHTPEKFAALEQSIRESGLSEPLRRWRDPLGEWWQLEGRHRVEIVNKLRAAGVTVAENGKPIEIVWEDFVGSEADAVEYCEHRDFHFRDLTQSQQAAVAVLIHGEKQRVKAKVRGVGAEVLEREDDAKEEQGGDVAGQLAARYGVNRDYVAFCRMCAKRHPDILAWVVNGEHKIHDCKEVVHRRAKGLPDFPMPGEDKEEPKAPQSDVEVLDGLRNPVGIEHAHIFITRADYKHAGKLVKDLIAAVEELADGPGGAWLPKQTFTSALHNIQKELVNSQPHVTCPRCSGTGKHPDKPGDRCTLCKGHKYIDRTQWKLVPDEVKALVPDQALEQDLVAV